MRGKKDSRRNDVVGRAAPLRSRWQAREIKIPLELARLLRREIRLPRNAECVVRRGGERLV